MKHNESRRKVCIGIISVILLLLIFAYSRSRNRVFINWEDIAGAGSGNSEATVQEAENSRTDPEEERIQRMCELVKEFDFTVPEQSINAEVCDAETDRKYKEAFLALIFDRGELSDKITDSGYTFADDIFMGSWPTKLYLKVIVNEAEYWYHDADGDGLPELAVYTNGALIKLRVLKYDPDRERAYVFFHGGDNNWNFLCAGNLYYRNPSTEGTLRYGLYRYDLEGNLIKAVDFHSYTRPGSEKYRISYYDGEDEDYVISLSGFVSEEIWEELTKGFQEAKKQVPPGMTFDEIFGDIAEGVVKENEAQ